MDPFSVKTELELPSGDSVTGVYIEGIRTRLFSMELQTRVFTGKGLEIHTVRVNNVLSFSCICLECERGFPTQSLLELHSRNHLQSEESFTEATTSASVVRLAAEDIIDNSHNNPDDCETVDGPGDVESSDCSEADADHIRPDQFKTADDHADVESGDCSETDADDNAIDVKDSSTENREIPDLPVDPETLLQKTLGSASADITEQTGNSEMRSLVTSSTSKDKYDCEASGISEQDTFQLIDISRLAENENIFECNFCDQKLRGKRTFIEHMNTHAEEKPHEGAVCVQRKRRVRPRKLRVRNQAVCDVCGKLFSAKCHLKRHRSVHFGEKPHSCYVCGKQFRLREQVKEHMKVHQKEKPHVCSLCGKSFSRSYYLNRHVRKHGDKAILSFQCDVCGKTFKHRASLYVHAKTHTSEKQFVCSECGKTFYQKFYLDEHFRIHTGERPIKCPHCDLTFRMRESLRIHLRRQHQESKQHTGTETSSASALQNTSSPNSNPIIYDLDNVSEDV